MDDTQQSRTSDANTTRKRRSSILKSQRPPRTPFSELEFNVATPTDTVKSRRVSFSRRTGVAEYVTNEATTTWKNFYEEHNKSLELSGNDSEVKAPRQAISHIGKRTFDEQFEVVEAVDFPHQIISSLNNNTSINNIHLTQQVASSECTDSIQLAAPQSKFELSTFTENIHSKLFGDDLTAPTMGEMSGQIGINFSDIHTIDQEKDDLDEIRKDLERAQDNVMSMGPFTDGQNMSEYIEIDLNTTQITVRNEESDMSITDTIHSPKVQDVSKSCSFDKKLSQSKDWVTDKENIALNPYIAPRESANFAINEENDKVLVFDGKRLTLQSDKEDKNYRQTLPPNGPVANIPQRKTIVLNVNDDLPNFIEDMHNSKNETFRGPLKSSFVDDLPDFQMNHNKNLTTGDQENKSMSDRVIRNTIVSDNDAENISVTQAIPSNILLPENNARPQRRNTIVSDNDAENISVTQAIPSNILLPENNARPQRRNTIVYDNDAGNISVTQAIPSNIILPENNARPQRRNTIVYDNDAGNISVTQAIPSNILLPENNARPQRRNTIVYDNDAGNISVTQAIPSNIILPENNARPQRRNTIVYDNDAGNISVTQAIPSNILLPENNARPQRRNTIVYENDAGDISVTQAIPSNIILPENNARPQRRNTIVYENDTGNISVTQAIPSNIIVPEIETRSQRRNTIVYDNDAGNISITQAIPSNIIVPENEVRAQKRNPIVYDHDAENISVTQAIPSNIILTENNARPQRRNTIVYENDTGNISITQAIPSNIIVPEIETRSQRRNTIVYDSDAGNISVTQVIPSNNIVPQNEARPQRRNTIVYDNDAGNISITQSIPSDIILQENIARPQRRNTIVYDDDAGNISVTQAIPRNIIFCENNTKRQTIVDDNQKTNTSTIQTIPNEIIMEDKIVQQSKLLEDDVNNMYVSEAPNILREKETSQKDNMMENRKSNFTLSELKNTILQQTGNAPVARKMTNNTRIFDEQILSEQKITSIHKTDLSNISITTHSITNTLNTSENRYLIDKRNSVDMENDRKAIDLNDNESNISVKALSVSIEPKLKTQEESLDKLCISTQKRDGKNNCKSIEHGNDVADISMTPAYITSSTLEENRSKDEKMVIKDGDVIMKNSQPSCSIIGQVNDNASNVQDKKETTRNSIDVNMSAMQNVLPSPTNKKKKESLSPSNENLVSQDMKRGKKGLSDGNACITKPIPTMLLSIQREIIEEPDKECKMNIEPHTINQEVLLYQVSTNHSETLEFKTNNQNNVDNERHLDEGKTIKTIGSDQEKNVSQSIEKANNKNMECIIYDECILDGSKRSTTDDFEIDCTKKSYDEINMNGKGISNEFMNGGIDDKNEMAVVESDDQLSENAKSVENDENMFYITKDIDDHKRHSYDFKQNVSSSSCQEKKQDDSEEVNHFQKKLLELKSVIHDDTDSPPQNRHYEEIKCSNGENYAISRRQTLNSTIERKSYKSADDTDYLLQMLSDLTENKASDIIEEEEKPKPIEVKGRIALENKSEVLDKRRISFIPKRQSIVLSREDLLNNISLAKAALQKSRYELEETEEDTEKDSSVEEESPQKKVVRMSNEVVKTLHFEEDDSVSETSIKSDILSPLKKTAFGETSYMKESKAKVIPSYLKDVSDGIKALMHDLVKPTADTMPFEAVGLDQSLKKIPSTCSTEIQANLITSSQIDLNTELYSNPTSTYDIKTQAAYANEVLMSGNRAMAHPIKSTAKSFPILEPEKSSETEVTDESGKHIRCKQALHGQTMPAKVLVFDHENPLNNILLVPTDCADVHKYNPVKSDETICDTARSHCEQKAVNGKDIEVERVAMQYNVDGQGLTSHVIQQSDFPCAQKIADVQSITSTTSKPMSIDQSVDVKMIEVKDIEINTSITMKGNKELLETSSSLTLVDDALAQNAFDIDLDAHTTTSPRKFQATKPKSPVKIKIINQIDECGIQSETIDSDFTSNDEESTKLKENKRKKRNYSSIKHKNTTFSEVDVTPKPTCKVQKMSTTPKNLIKTILEPHHASPEKNKFTTQRSEQMTDEEMPSPGKVKNKSRRNSKDKTGTTITVQRLVTEYNNDSNVDRTEQIMHALANQSCNANAEHLDEAKSPDEACSFTSSNNVNNKDEHSVSTSSQPESEISMRSSSHVTWQPDLINEISSKNLVSECESSVNVVAKIDMFPFMGSHECEWEWSCADAWAFRLLHGRLRLCVRLAHRLDNAARTCVRADTPVLALNVEIAHHDKKNPVAMTCVRFAAETMRYLCVAAGGAGGAGAEGVRAGDVPALVRRCAAAARVAGRWGRAMQAARARLAFRLGEDGRLSLKVANVSLRSVWEVSLRLELVVQEGGAPWPRASDVRVSPLVSEWRVPPAHVRAALAAVPADWGHVPRTVWKIFKYLKNKTRDDDLLAA